MATVGGWLTDAEHIVISERETIERMKRTILTAEQLYMIIGMLASMRVACDTNIKAIKYTGGVYPLNQAQICRFTEDLLVTQHEKGRISAWDLYNSATERYKPMTAETNLIMPQNMAMVRFLREQEIF